MNPQLTLSVSPHIHSGRRTSRIMLDVIIALLPAAIAGVVIFGLRALLVLAVTVVSCVGFEALYVLASSRHCLSLDLRSTKPLGLSSMLNMEILRHFSNICQVIAPSR